MNVLKTLLSSVLAASLLTGAALAAEIGVVDTQEIASKYAKAQTIASQVKDKEAELNKLRDDYAGQLKAGSKLSPVEKKNLEDKLNSQFSAKFKEYRDWTVSQEEAIRSDVDKAVQQVATAQKLDLVLPKQVVMEGGKDITPDVITALNK